MDLVIIGPSHYQSKYWLIENGPTETNIDISFKLQNFSLKKCIKNACEMWMV